MRRANSLRPPAHYIVSLRNHNIISGAFIVNTYLSAPIRQTSFGHKARCSEKRIAMLYEKLKKYASEGTYPMHMPGHKRNIGVMPDKLPYDVDITEIDGFDDLHDPHGALLETAGLASELYGSDKAFLLINGSTSGILSAIGACARSGDKVLMARNCHLSVYNAVALFGLKPLYMAPETDEKTGVAGSIDPAAVESALRSTDDVKLVVITSPTYEGAVSDVGAIAGIAHKRNIPLLVDAAHGAHLGFSDGFPDSPVRLGADATVMSLHKTLPALTQCALLHICGGLINTGEIARMTSVFQTSSPSYVLLASIDSCLRLLAADRERLFGEYERNLDDFFEKTRNLKNIKLYWNDPEPGTGPGPVPGPGPGPGPSPGPGPEPRTRPRNCAPFAYDKGKIVLTTAGSAISGFELSRTLREEFRIELEMARPSYALAMTSICDAVEGFGRLARALAVIDGSVHGVRDPDAGVWSIGIPEQSAAPGEALKRRGDYAGLEESVGAMSLEYVWAYPPGIPLLAPGEIISGEAVSYIARSIKAGVTIRSDHGGLPRFIFIALP